MRDAYTKLKSDLSSKKNWFINTAPQIERLKWQPGDWGYSEVGGVLAWPHRQPSDACLKSKHSEEKDRRTRRRGHPWLPTELVAGLPDLCETLPQNKSILFVCFALLCFN